MKYIKGFLSLYRPMYPKVLVYMLQSTEYQAPAYLAWYWRTVNFAGVVRRRMLDKTKAARMLLLAVRVGIGFQILLALFALIVGLVQLHGLMIILGLILLFSYPIVWAHLLVVPLVLGRIFVTKPAEKRLIAKSAKIFAEHPGVKIAVAGSYGKTTMKELLATVLSEGLSVAATPANKNVSSSHAYFAQKLTGKEDVLVIEYGEGEPVSCSCTD